MTRRITCAALVLAALGACTAAAATPATYHGHWGQSKTANLTFKVIGGNMRDFHTTVAALCLTSTGPFGLGSTFQEQTFVVPRAPIHGGHVNTTYKIRDAQGQVTGQRTVTATFHGGHANGTLSGSSYGCTIAKYSWTARL